MKFFHLSDLHIGKQLHRYNLKEDQEAILASVVKCAKEMRPDAIIIAGDIYDKSTPSAEAVTIFDEFLTSISRIEPVIQVLIISGNHDSAERLQYASAFLKQHHIHVAPSVPQSEEEHINKITLSDEYGEVDFYLLPFLKPSYVRGLFAKETAETYSDVIKALLERENIDFKHRRNVLVTHQFYTGGKEETVTCDSEMITVGGLNNVDMMPLVPFEYAALGHLHGAQAVGVPHVRYCGTLLKYSVSESEHEKSLTVVTLLDKGESADIGLFPLQPLRDVKKKKGTLKELLEIVSKEEQDAYISLALTDEIEPYKPKEQLEKVYSHILEIRVDNTRVRQKLLGFDVDEIDVKDPLTAFSDFYEEVQGNPMGEEEYAFVQAMIEQIGEESV